MWPLTKFEASDARKTTGPNRSSSSQRALHGNTAPGSQAGNRWIVNIGATMLVHAIRRITLTFDLWLLDGHGCVNWLTPRFRGAHAASPARPLEAPHGRDIDDLAPARASITRAACLQQEDSFRLTSITRCQASTIGTPQWCRWTIPWLLTRMSIRPYICHVSDQALDLLLPGGIYGKSVPRRPSEWPPHVVYRHRHFPPPTGQRHPRPNWCHRRPAPSDHSDRTAPEQSQQPASVVPVRVLGHDHLRE